MGNTRRDLDLCRISHSKLHVCMTLYIFAGMFEQKVIIRRGDEVLMTLCVQIAFLQLGNSQAVLLLILLEWQHTGVFLCYFLQAFANRWQTLLTGLKQSYLTWETSDCFYLSLIIVITVQPEAASSSCKNCYNWHGSMSYLLGLKHPRPFRCELYSDQNSKTLAVEPASLPDKAARLGELDANVLLSHFANHIKLWWIEPFLNRAGTSTRMQ